MENILQPREKSVCVALSLTEESDELVKTAESLCIKSGMRLRLVNVCEPWIDSVSLGMIPIPEVDIAIQLEVAARADTKLREIAGKIDRRIKVETQALTGVIADAIIADAGLNNAALIICGRKSPKKHFLPTGFSSAMALLSHARIPVLVIQSGNLLNFVSPSLSFIVGDDLRPSTMDALEKALDFSVLLGAKVHHVHCTSVSKFQLKSALLTQMDRLTTRNLDADDLYRALIDNLGKKMRQRAESINVNLNASLYTNKIIEEPAIEGIIAYAHALKDTQSILVFGRHHSLHFKPFGVGQVPFKTMLNSSYPILVVPS